MSEILHEDFELILEDIKNRLSNKIEFEEPRSLESNVDTKGMSFKRKTVEFSDGTIIMGEDNCLIAVDISKDDGEVVSFIIKDKEDKEGIDNVVSWLEETYS